MWNFGGKLKVAVCPPWTGCNSDTLIDESWLKPEKNANKVGRQQGSQSQFIGVICIHGDSFSCRLCTDLKHTADPRGPFCLLAFVFCLITSGQLSRATVDNQHSHGACEQTLQNSHLSRLGAGSAINIRLVLVPNRKLM